MRPAIGEDGWFGVFSPHRWPAPRAVGAFTAAAALAGTLEELSNNAVAQW